MNWLKENMPNFSVPKEIAKNQFFLLAVIAILFLFFPNNPYTKYASISFIFFFLMFLVNIIFTKAIRLSSRILEFSIISALVIIWIVNLFMVPVFEDKWQGFYYKNAEYSSNQLQEKMMLNEAPAFSSLQDCMKWGSTIITNNSDDGFECSYGCRFDEKYNTIICEDTTKMIYKNRFIK